MADLRSEAEVVLVDRRDFPIGSLRIADSHRSATIRVLDQAEAARSAEEKVQLLEGGTYDYQLVGAEGLEIDSGPLIQPNRFGRWTGRIEPGLSTGLLPIALVDPAGKERAWGAVEVRTDKLDYQDQYRQMLDDIATATTALIMHFSGPTAVRLKVERTDADSLHQQFAILRRILQSRDLDDAVHRVLGQPARRWITESGKRTPDRIDRVDAAVIRQLASGRRREPIPATHSLRQVFAGHGHREATVPTTIVVDRDRETIDIPENRFVKFALEDWDDFIEAVEERARVLQPSIGKRLARETAELRETVGEWLANDLFREVSRADRLPLESPLLQRRGGYREILESWLEFQFATSLTWDGGREAFAAGQRNVAALYEFWVFFKLLAIVEQTFELDVPAHRTLIERTANGFDLRLKSGKELSFRGKHRGGDRELNIRFSYNRTYPGAEPDLPSYPSPGAWTRPMRPDFTVSLWPVEFSEAEAERQELMVHVHFDAKYRVEDWTGLFGINSNEVLDEERVATQSGGAPKRADLLKMHAYRDAIRRTEGAYVIYPGRHGQENVSWFAFNDVLPGLGAFALRPGAEAIGLENLRTFLEDRAAEAGRNSERLDQSTYHTFRIQEPSGQFRSSVDIPAQDDHERQLRKRPSIEHE
ncbi:MAG: DUF2357 domain-containing protein [Chloroflexota bacterium]|nr:DUF2357 domain-containing protein [Chloroflexota bacterium]